jgi:tetratricopeptide (TPR) repeat protein
MISPPEPSPDLSTPLLVLIDEPSECMGLVDSLDDCAAMYRVFAAGHIKNGDLRGALESYTRVIAMGRGDSYVLTSRGYLHMMADDLSQAEEDLDAAFKKNPNFIGVRINRSILYTKLGRYPSALYEADEAIRLQPDYLMTWLAKGDVYAAMGKIDQALRMYEHAHAMDRESIFPIEALKKIGALKRE